MVKKWMKRMICVIMICCLFTGLSAREDKQVASAADNNTTTDNNATKVEAADTVLKNGYIYTVDKKTPEAEAVAIKDGLICFVGSNSDVEQYVGSLTKVIDLGGKMVMPSFFDAHGHGSSKTGDIYAVNLKTATTADEYAERINAFLKENPKASMIKGYGWSNTVFGSKSANKEILDKITTKIPVCLTSEDYHSVWVNSKALEMAGITDKTPNPEGGVIERDKNGEATGTLRESAQHLISLPDYTVDQYKEGILTYQKELESLGFSGNFDAVIGAGSNSMSAYKELAKSGELVLRVRGAYATNALAGAAGIKKLAKLKGKDDVGNSFKMVAIKFFADGVVEGLTGALTKPYAGKFGANGFKGNLIWKPEEMKKAFAIARKAGFQTHTHAIGDAAVKETLDSIAYAQKTVGGSDCRDGITHLQLVRPSDITRMAKLGAVAVVNPYWAFKDDYYYNLQLPYLGKKRADQEYPIQSLINAGVVISTASDYPVTTPPNPFYAIEIGITRTVNDGDMLYGQKTSDDPKYKLPLWPEESATMEEMIKSCTLNAAYTYFMENTTGSITVGKSADLIVLDQNLFKTDVNKIHDTKILENYFNGKLVYKSEK